MENWSVLSGVLAEAGCQNDFKDKSSLTVLPDSNVRSYAKQINLLILSSSLCGVVMIGSKCTVQNLGPITARIGSSLFLYFYLL